MHVYPLSSRNSLWHKRFTSRRMRIETRVSSRDITKKTQTVSWPKFPSVTWTFMMAPIFPWKAKTLCKNSDFKYIHYYIIYTLYILQPMIVLGYHLHQSWLLIPYTMIKFSFDLLGFPPVLKTTWIPGQLCLQTWKSLTVHKSLIYLTVFMLSSISGWVKDKCEKIVPNGTTLTHSNTFPISCFKYFSYEVV